MPTLIIRDVPEKTYKQLKLNAERHRRSLAKEALVTLEERLNPYDVPKIDWSKLPKIRLKGTPDLSPEAIQAMIDEGQK
jgi:plasmid stability protein